MIDHTGVSVSDPARSRRFYEQALAPLGYKVIMQTPVEHTGGLVVLGLGVPPMPDFWLYEGTPQKPHIHVAIRADEPRGGRRLLRLAAMAAGGARQRRAGDRALAVSPELLRRVRPRSRRAQHRGVLSPAAG